MADEQTLEVVLKLLYNHLRSSSCDIRQSCVGLSCKRHCPIICVWHVPRHIATMPPLTGCM